jgi:hypothetical protein
MDSTTGRGPYDDTPLGMSKSTNISQSETKLTDLGTQATSGPTLQVRPSYVSTATNGLPFLPLFHPERYDFPYSYPYSYEEPQPQGEFRVGPPLEHGPPPPGLRSGLSKKKKEDARPSENRLTNVEPKPTTSYAPDVTQYPKASPDSFVQRMYSSFRSHKHDSSAPRLPDMGDSRGEEGPSSNSAQPLDERETPTTPPSALLRTQNQRKHVVGVKNINSTVPSTPLPLPAGDPQTHATSSNTSPAMLNAPSYLEKGREYQAQPGLYPPKSQHSPEQPAATGPVTAQPSPQELYHPLARENRQGEGHGVQLPSSDIRNPVLRTRSSENRTSFWC